MKIAAGEFRAHCLELIDRVHSTHEEILITKRGVIMAKLVAAGKPVKRPLFGAMKGSVTILGDLVQPIDEPWQAERLQ